jgi:hypothetical protein
VQVTYQTNHPPFRSTNNFGLVLEGLPVVVLLRLLALVVNDRHFIVVVVRGGGARKGGKRRLVAALSILHGLVHFIYRVHCWYSFRPFSWKEGGIVRTAPLSYQVDVASLSTMILPSQFLLKKHFLLRDAIDTNEEFKSQITMIPNCTRRGPLRL